MSIWNYIFRRSQQNAAKADARYNPPEDTLDGCTPGVGQRIETNLETESIQGLFTRFVSVDGAIKHRDGQLITTRNTIAVLLGCSHVVTQLQAVDQEDQHIRGIAGKCYYCDEEIQPLIRKGQISPLDAERLSLVCSDCGKITVSGRLCCPKHYAAITNPDGTTVYLGPKDVQEQQRQSTVKMVLDSVASLFGQVDPKTPQENPQENNNG